ncbi:MAG: glycosyltransferase family 4 protein [Candidatus Aenigmatarchaeota archaeon]
MKLAYICPWFSTEYKGPLYNLLDALSKKIEVVCVCSRQKYVQYFDRKEKYGNKIEFLSKNFKIHRFESIAPRDIIIPFDIEEILEKEKPNIIQSDEFFRFTSIKAWKYAKKKGIPFILNSRMRKRPGIIRNLFYKIMSLLAKDMVEGATKIVAVGGEAKREFLKWFPKAKKKIVIIPTGIDPKKFKIVTGKDCIKFRKKYRIPLNKKIILDVGRIYPVKRIDLLIKVFKLVKEKIKDVVLIVVGPTERKEMKKIQKFISKLNLKMNEDVFFIGSIPNEKIRPVYATSNIFVNTSETEGICFSFLEAMCFGLPIIAFNVGGNKDVIENGKNGFLISFGDTEKMAKKIIEVLTNPTLKERLSLGSREILKRKFHLKKVIKNLTVIFNEILFKFPKLKDTV